MGINVVACACEVTFINCSGMALSRPARAVKEEFLAWNVLATANNDSANSTHSLDTALHAEHGSRNQDNPPHRSR